MAAGLRVIIRTKFDGKSWWKSCEIKKLVEKL